MDRSLTPCGDHCALHQHLRRPHPGQFAAVCFS